MIDKQVADILIRSLSSTIAFARGGGNGGSSDTDHERLGFVGHVVQDLVEGGGRVGQPGHRPRPLLLQGRRAPRQAPEDHAAPPSGQTGRRGFRTTDDAGAQNLSSFYSLKINFSIEWIFSLHYLHSNIMCIHDHQIVMPTLSPFFSISYTMFFISDFPYSKCLRLIQYTYIRSTNYHQITPSSVHKMFYVFIES